MRIPESGKFLLVESGILGFVIRNSAQGIRNPSNDSNPESSTWNPESQAWNPELFGLAHMERLALLVFHRIFIERIISIITIHPTHYLSSNWPRAYGLFWK